MNKRLLIYEIIFVLIGILLICNLSMAGGQRGNTWSTKSDECLKQMIDENGNCITGTTFPAWIQLDPILQQLVFYGANKSLAIDAPSGNIYFYDPSTGVLNATLGVSPALGDLLLDGANSVIFYNYMPMRLKVDATSGATFALSVSNDYACTSGDIVLVTTNASPTIGTINGIHSAIANADSANVNGFEATLDNNFTGNEIAYHCGSNWDYCFAGTNYTVDSVGNIQANSVRSPYLTGTSMVIGDEFKSDVDKPFTILRYGTAPHLLELLNTTGTTPLAYVDGTGYWHPSLSGAGTGTAWNDYILPYTGTGTISLRSGTGGGNTLNILNTIGTTPMSYFAGDGSFHGAVFSKGTLGMWQATTSIPLARVWHTTVVNNNYIYTLGGYTGPSYLNDVQYAPINANGTIGAWTATTSFTTARKAHTTVVYNGYMYILGGSNSGLMSDVQFAPINVDGTVGAWTATTSFTTAREGHTSVAYNGYLYVIGGSNGSAMNNVQYAPINPADGTVGAWTATTSLAVSSQFHTSVTYNGYLYVIGGQTSTPLATVQYAPINPDGTIGTWNTTTPLPTARYSHSSVLYDNFLYILGGKDAGANLLGEVWVAQIFSNGSIGVWTACGNFVTPRYTNTSAYNNKFIYTIGGHDGVNYLADVQYSQVN